MNTSKQGMNMHITKKHKGIKNMISADNDREKTAENRCKVCRKIIHLEEFAKCTSCSGVEHYGCSETGKEFRAEYISGKYPFKCNECTLPAIECESYQQIYNKMKKKNDPIAVRVENEAEETMAHIDSVDDDIATVTNTKQPNKEIVGEMLTNIVNVIVEVGEEELNGSNEEAETVTLEEETTSKAKDNLINSKGDNTEDSSEEFKSLKLKHEQLLFENECIKNEREELKEENENLKESNHKLETEKENTDEELNLQKIEYKRLQDVAMKRQAKLNEALTDTSLQLARRDDELVKIVKEKEKIIQENKTYAALNEEKDKEVIRLEKQIEVLKNKTGVNIDLSDIESEEDFDEDSDLEILHQGKNSGYRRDSPANKSVVTNKMAPKPKVVTAGPNSPEINQNTDVRKGMFCHFFNNSTCRNTADTCSYSHTSAPPCREWLQGGCNRNMCRYSHKSQDFQDGRQTRPGSRQPPAYPPRPWGPVGPWYPLPPRSPMMGWPQYETNFPPMQTGQVEGWWEY